MLTDSKSVTPGLALADKKIMTRDLVQPVRVVAKRLKKLPWYPSSHEDLNDVLDELRIALADVLAQLG